MINFGNIQAAAVKSIYKNKRKGELQEYTVWNEKDGIVPLSYQNSVIFFVPAEKCLLKSTLDTHEGSVIDLFMKSLNEIKEDDKLTDLKTTRECEPKLNMYKTKEGEEIHLKSDYVKMFGEKAEFYKGVEKVRGFIFVKESDIWVGCLGSYKVR
nr:MAG TPA: hypothetical protein [Caudoviricetes sp.]